ncbi:MAG TPA: DUF992 domain-containing protein [Pararhizobium sp.]|uniref:DUF992 domain-containing protein n=1 Tax=Pararhizobium sp. TaxID=1977563 RepID=UPI002B5C047B|nr:DUF992 domain-containing protein [Pararhizobium sp.]HTO29838.1 DUF992 domain-containing protein [Pararhizobium sp.]
MMKRTLVAAAVLAAIWTVPADAASYVTLGRLVCASDGGVGMIISSQKALKCTYTPASGGPAAIYDGKISKIGIDVGQTGKSVMMWNVLAKTGASDLNFPLSGDYYGLGVDASFAAGAGAKVLGGGLDKAFMLQPVNVQVQEGLNVAVGVEKMTLSPAAI